MAEEKRKYCPLKFAIPLERVMSLDCDKGCAWWDDITGLCAIAVIARFGSESAFYVGRQKQKADMKGVSDGS